MAERRNAFYYTRHFEPLPKKDDIAGKLSLSQVDEWYAGWPVHPQDCPDASAHLAAMERTSHSRCGHTLGNRKRIERQLLHGKIFEVVRHEGKFMY